MHIMIKSSVQLQKDRHKTVGGATNKRYILPVGASNASRTTNTESRIAYPIAGLRLGEENNYLTRKWALYCKSRTAQFKGADTYIRDNLH